MACVYPQIAKSEIKVHGAVAVATPRPHVDERVFDRVDVLSAMTLEGVRKFSDRVLSFPGCVGRFCSLLLMTLLGLHLGRQHGGPACPVGSAGGWCGEALAWQYL